MNHTLCMCAAIAVVVAVNWSLYRWERRVSEREWREVFRARASLLLAEHDRRWAEMDAEDERLAGLFQPKGGAP